MAAEMVNASPTGLVGYGLLAVVQSYASFASARLSTADSMGPGAEDSACRVYVCVSMCQLTEKETK